MSDLTPIGASWARQKLSPSGFSRTHLDDGTLLTGCTQPPRHHPQRTSPWVIGGCAQSLYGVSRVKQKRTGLMAGPFLLLGQRHLTVVSRQPVPLVGPYGRPFGFQPVKVHMGLYSRNSYVVSPYSRRPGSGCPATNGAPLVDSAVEQVAPPPDTARGLPARGQRLAPPQGLRLRA
jgi:hypothetical protein